jgi:pimeloyl-ACP methyl ester carboxylesterase
LLPHTAEAAEGIGQSRIFFKAAEECLEQGDLEGAVEKFIDGVTGPGTWKNIPERNRYIFLANAWSIKGLLADSETSVSCADLGRIDLPVLLIAGEKSARAYKLMMEGIEPCIQHQKKVIVPGAAHAMNHGNPQVFNAAVLDFLEGH